MGQIVFNGQRPKYCNIQAIRTGGQHVNDDVALNEIWLVDTTNSAKTETGTGEYDAYIIGDGILKAGQLELHYLATAIDLDEYSTTTEMMTAIQNGISNANIPRRLSQLTQDSENMTVTQTEKDIWNAGGAGQITNNVDNEDLTSVEIAEDVNVIKFKDKDYDAFSYSGFGRKYLRKHLTTEYERTVIDITPAIGTDEEDPSEDPEETAEKTKNYYVDLSAGINGTAVVTYKKNVGYLRKEVYDGDVLHFQAYTKGAISGWFWGIIDKTTNEIYERGGNYSGEDMTQHSDYITVELPEGVESAYLVINIVTYNNPIYFIKKTKNLDAEKEFNILDSLTGSNTIFEVNYDYDLNCRMLRLPENSVLKFNGGSIKNATIVGNNTTIIADGNDNIFGRNTEILGTWKNITWYARWFGVYADGVRDDTPVLQRMLELSVKTGSSRVVCDWYGCTFRTTKGLFIRSATTILGGTIKAKFDNPLDWVLQTYSLYNGTKVVRYNGLLAADEGMPTWGGFIKDLKIRGELNDNGDGTWAPIFGGIRLMTTSMATENVDIRDVGYGMARAATVVARDTNLVSFTYFCSYLANDVINLEVNTAYFQAHCHHTSSGPNDEAKHIPFATEYHPVRGFLLFEDEFIDGNGGIDDTDPELRRPRLTDLKLNNTSAVFNNVAVDFYQEVAFAFGNYTEVVFNTTRFEDVVECYVYLGGAVERITLNQVITSRAAPTYDIYQKKQSSAAVNLINAPALSCSNTGKVDATTHKLYHHNDSGLSINVFGKRTSGYPNSDVFHFLSGDYSAYIVPNGYEASYTAGNGQYVLPSNIGNGTIKNLIVQKDTTVAVPTNTTYLQSDVIITGEDRTTSIFKVLGDMSFGNTYNVPASLEFRNITIDCTSGRFRMRTNSGDGGYLKFTKCNIIVGDSNPFVTGEAALAVPYNVIFNNCNIYSRRQAVFDVGHIMIESNQYSLSYCSPIIRYGLTEDASSKKVELDFIQKGTTANRNAITYHLGKGHRFYNISTGRDEVWNGRQWVLGDGYPYILIQGTSANTPAKPLMKIGSEYKDTTEGVKKELVTNGTCGYGTFAFNVAFPKVSRNIYIGATPVTVTDGEFSVSLPAGTYPVSCHGYRCYPSTVTISEGASLSIYQKATIYTTTYKVTITAKDSENNTVTNLTIRVGGRTATVPSGKSYYEVNLYPGDYIIMAEGYADQIPLKVNGRTVSITATFATEASSETVTATGTVYDHDHICNGEGTNITAGNYAVTVDNTSLTVSLTSTLLNIILYFINDTAANINKQLACLLMKKWFEAGHYGELSGNNVKLYSDTVGTTTGNTATFTDTSTNLVCTATPTVGTNATWEVVSSDGSSDPSMSIVAASGTALSTNVNTYYTFAAAVNTLAVTLPAMTDVTSVKALCLAFTTGTTPQITFTASDGKTVAYYDTYNIDAECEYEVTCLFNGTKWIVSSALIS